MSSSIITLGEKSNKLLYPLLASISHFLYEIGNLLLSKKANNSNGLGKHEFVLSWILFLSEASFCEKEKMIEDFNETMRILFSNKESIIGRILMFFGICGFNIFRMKTIHILSNTSSTD